MRYIIKKLNGLTQHQVWDELREIQEGLSNIPVKGHSLMAKLLYSPDIEIAKKAVAIFRFRHLLPNDGYLSSILLKIALDYKWEDNRPFVETLKREIHTHVKYGFNLFGNTELDEGVDWNSPLANKITTRT